jgi:hypothetical protein
MLDALVNAAQGLRSPFQQQIAAVEHGLLPGIESSGARIYRHCDAQETATTRSRQFAQSFSIAGEKQENVVEEATTVLLSKLPLVSDIEKARRHSTRRKKWKRGREVPSRF